MIRVGVNGFGTIGRRVADAVMKQGDMKLVGVTKTKPDYKSKAAVERGIDIYAVENKNLEAFKASGYSVRGVLNDLLQRVDVVVDASPEDVGATSRSTTRRGSRRSSREGRSTASRAFPSSRSATSKRPWAEALLGLSAATRLGSAGRSMRLTQEWELRGQGRFSPEGPQTQTRRARAP
jgi:glyceraldehyde-3-phosphate dehydrogenase (NAD(P))